MANLRQALVALSLALTQLVGVGLAAAEPLRLRLPFNDPKGTLFLLKPILHVDHDPQQDPLGLLCVNYDGVGFPWCYDEHRGTDFLLRSAFATMDSFDVEVVAAADGVVVEVVDGNYDRCHGSMGQQVSCDGYPVAANRVVLRHAGGTRTLYYHLKKGSVKVVERQSVSCGDLLGHVGSSGVSAAPHLHFELRDKEGDWIDPFAGPRSQPASYWVEQAGPFARPAPRCQGELVPADAGAGPSDGPSGEAGPNDSGLTGGDPPGAPGGSTGCSLTARHPPPGPLLYLLALLLWVVWIRRQRR